MVLPPYYLEVVLCGNVGGGVTVMVYKGRFLQMLLESFSKGPGGLSYIFIITCKFSTLQPVDGPTFLLHWVLFLGRHQNILNSPAASELDLYAITSADFLYAFTWALGVRYDNVTLGLGFSHGGLSASGVLVLILLLPSLVSCENLLSTLSMAHLGYLQLLSAFLRWSISFWRNSGLLVLALWWGY